MRSVYLEQRRAGQGLWGFSTSEWKAFLGPRCLFLPPPTRVGSWWEAWGLSQLAILQQVPSHWMEPLMFLVPRLASSCLGTQVTMDNPRMDPMHARYIHFCLTPKSDYSI